jgi:RNA polymerase sigma factor (sigma-70 family)
MARSDVQDSARIGTEVLEVLFFELLPEITVAVRHTYLNLGYYADPATIEDTAQQITLLLLNHDNRALRTYDRRALPKTWLTAVVRNYVKRDLRHRSDYVSLEGVPEHSLSYSSNQDSIIAVREQRRLLEEAISKLTHRERELFCLFCDDSMSTHEIAVILGIQLASVYRYKFDLIKKLRILITSMSG